jgi:two-component system, LuxR family, sensor kinase FixL
VTIWMTFLGGGHAAVVNDAVMNRPDGEEIAQRARRAIRLALKVLLVGVICSLSTEIGFAHKVQPHNISALWPTNAILFAVLVVTPIRHWWAYTLAAYLTSIINDARAGFPLSAILFIVGDIIEVFIAAVGVRRFADGIRAFDNLRSLVAYIVVAMILAPFSSAFVGAFAATPESYWFYWRVWFLSEALAYLTLAPAVLTGIGAARTALRNGSLARCIEACLIGGGLLAIGVRVFIWPTPDESSVPALVYLPLPFLLWAAVRFGPLGVNTSLLIVALLSISGTVHGRGPFATSSPAENVLSLQLFLLVISLPLMFLGALIAERREKTNGLRESEARFRSMADTAPVLIWMSGPDKLCTFLNKGWLDFTGRPLEQGLGNGWVEGIHPDDVAQYLATYVSAFDARREFAIEYRLRRHDSEYRSVLDKGVPRLAPDGTFLGYIGCADDITARKDAEVEVQRHRAELAHVARMSMMGELTASLAHELNQPLGAILNHAGAAQCFLATNPAKMKEVQESLGDITNAAQHAAEVIRRLRALVRKEQPDFAPVDLGSVIHDVVLLVHGDAALHKIRVSVEADSGLPPVQGDKIQLQQVVLNLLMNAFDAMRDCPATERNVVVRAEMEGTRIIKVSARDRGTGLSAGNLDRIFRPFFTTKREGLGMGLSISRAIIEAHGGRLWAENNPDRGATFYFTVPLGL